MKKTKKTIVCIHCFRAEYLKHMPYLSSLTENYMHGALKSPEGFMSSINTFFNGKNNILAFFYHDKNSNYLNWTVNFSFLENFGFFGRFFLNVLVNLKALIEQKHLMITWNIPIKKLKYFDTEIKNWKRKDINFIYFYDIDKVAHKYGTFSPQIIRHLKKIDRKLKKIDFDILFSDHGIMDVNKLIKVPESEICFIDSTLARYWGSKKELKKIKNKLPLKYGRIINWQDKRYGELIFQANPGTLISPNYWQGEKKVKAMHGYNSKDKEMLGFYLLKEKGKKKNLSMEELHEIFFS